MEHQKTNSNLHRQHDDWDEVHSQLIDVQRHQKIQKKSLTISSPGDADEKEADDVARKVSNGESAEIHGTGSTVSRKGEGSAETTPDFQSKLESSKGGGKSLPANVQQEMGSKMGTDFSGVKIHTGSEAHAMNESVNAKAFTHGQDIYFGKNNSPDNKELLAHELVHTSQQKGAESIQRVVNSYDIATIAELLHSEMNAVDPPMNEQKIFSNLQKLGKNQKNVDDLKSSYQTKFLTEIENDLRTKLNGDSLQLALELLNIKATDQQIDLISSYTIADTDYPLIAKRINEALTNDPVLPQIVFASLIPLNRDKTKLKKLDEAYKKESTDSAALIADIKKYISSDLNQQSYAVYLAFNYDPVGVTPNPITTGTEKINTPLPGGGKVTAHTGAAYSRDAKNIPIPNMFTVGYKGGLAKDSDWLQFVWREVYFDIPDSNGMKTYHYPLLQFASAGGNLYSVTTDPANPIYAVDGKPFYPGGKIREKDNTKEGSVEMYDAPSSAMDKTRNQVSGLDEVPQFRKDIFAGGATELRSTIHLHAYLIRDYYPVYQVTNSITWTYKTASDAGVRQFGEPTGTEVSKLDPKMKAKLDVDYSDFSYIH